MLLILSHLVIMYMSDWIGGVKKIMGSNEGMKGIQGL